VRLLIVDDSALMRKVTHLAFPATKFEVEEAENGFGAPSPRSRSTPSM
jgi:CheY-like chemotaxis protein